MKTYYEIVLWVGSSNPYLSVRHFDLKAAAEALSTYKNNVAFAKEYRRNNPKSGTGDGLPYISIRRWNRFGSNYIEYGHEADFERQLSELPNYIQKKLADLIDYNRADK